MDSGPRRQRGGRNDCGSIYAATAAARLMKALANADRLMLLCQLSQGEMTVSELESALGILQPTLSQQLAVLRDERVELLKLGRGERVAEDAGDEYGLG